MAYATVMGNLPRNPEYDADRKMTKFTVADNVGFGKNEDTTWWNCAIFGKRAEVVAEHFKKGDKILVNGEAQVRTFDKRDGTKGFAAELRVSDFRFVGGGKARRSEEQASPRTKPAPAPAPSNPEDEPPF